MNGYEQVAVRAALRVSGALALPLIMIFTVWLGWTGLWGASVATAIVVVFLIVHLVLGAFTRNLDPIATMAMAMLTYVAKIFVLALVLVGFRGATWMDRTAFGVTAICVTAGWLAAEMRTFVKARFVLNEGYRAPEREGSDRDGG